MSHPLHEKTLRNLRNTRDLRADIASMAADLAHAPDARGRLIVAAPAISERTIRDEWERLLPALATQIRTRMALVIDAGHSRTPDLASAGPTGTDAVHLDRPNYRYEVLRLLIEADLRGEPESVKGLIGKLEVSQTPVYGALDALRSAGLVSPRGASLQLRVEDISQNLLARAAALPATLRFRFAQGTQPKPPAHLLARCIDLLASHMPGDDDGWSRMALSGVAAAIEDAAQLDLIGLPRLDLVAQVRPTHKHIAMDLLRALDDGLEHEANILAPAPVVVTVVRARIMHARLGGASDRFALALASDVFLSLLDMGLHQQALQYVKAVRT